MSVEVGLTRLAADFAQTAQIRISSLQREIFELQNELAKKHAESKSAGGALERAANYPVTRGVDYLCPACWVLDGRESRLQLHEGSGAEDNFDCGSCQRSFAIPFRD
jgi:hypothetical protein